MLRRRGSEVWQGLLPMCFLVRKTGFFYSGMTDSWGGACNLPSLLESDGNGGAGPAEGDRVGACRKVRQGAPSRLRSPVPSLPHHCPKPVATKGQRGWVSRSGNQMLRKMKKNSLDWITDGKKQVALGGLGVLRLYFIPAGSEGSNLPKSLSPQQRKREQFIPFCFLICNIPTCTASEQARRRDFRE